jgi:tetratricopeptide (TPR) repeat protein
MSFKTVGNAALDPGTLLQMRVSFRVGGESERPQARVELRCPWGGHPDLHQVPELLLWLFARTLLDVDGLHMRSADVCHMGAREYLDLIRECALNPKSEHAELRVQSGAILAALGGMDLLDSPLPNTDCAVVANLLPWPQVGPRARVCKVHLQGPVGDIAHVWAPLLALVRASGLLAPEDHQRLAYYLDALVDGTGRFNDVLDAARWVNQVLQGAEVAADRHATHSADPAAAATAGGVPDPPVSSPNGEPGQVPLVEMTARRSLADAPEARIRRGWHTAFWVLSALVFINSIGVGGVGAAFADPLLFAFAAPVETWAIACWLVLGAGKVHEGITQRTRSPLSRLRIAVPAGLAIVVLLVAAHIALGTAQKQTGARSGATLEDATSGQSALSAYQQALSNCEESTRVHNHAAAKEACAATVKATVEVTAESIKGWLYLASAQRGTGDSQAALDTLDAAQARGAYASASPEGKGTWDVERGNALLMLGRTAEALEYFTAAAQRARAAQPVFLKLLLDAENGAAAAEARSAQPSAAAVRLRGIEGAAIEGYANDKAALATYWNNRGNAEVQAGDLTAARTCLERAVQLATEALGPDSLDTAYKIANLGTVMYRQGEILAAAELLDSAILKVQAARAPATTYACSAGINAVMAWDAAGNTNRADRLCAYAVETCRAAVGEAGVQHGQALVACALVARNIGRPDAREVADKGLAIIRSSVGPGHPSAQTMTKAVTARFQDL